MNAITVDMPGRRAADSAAADFHGRLHVVHRLMEDAQRIGIAAGPLLQRLHRLIDDAFGNRLLAVVHEHVHETAQNDIAADINMIGDLTRRKGGQQCGPR